MDYNTAVGYIQGRTRFGIKLGLDRIRLLLRSLGEPHQFLPLIHVGGTNGKGSTAAMLASVFKAAGYRTGLFVSPHLHSYNERFFINGKPMSPCDFADLVTGVRGGVDETARLAGEEPTEFEILTAMAFQYFRRNRVDLAIIEVGLGGELDSTNVINQPLLSVITNVAYDHMDRLGNTLADIARAKAGIIKPGGYVVTAAEKEALQVIEEKCRAMGANLFRVDKTARWRIDHRSWTGQSFSATVFGREYDGLTLPLLGRHQLTNAVTALVSTEVLKRHRGMDIPPEAVYRGLETVNWPGRLEVAQRQPTIVLDVAHNVHGATALREAVMQLAHRRLILVVALLADKEREKVIETLAIDAYAVVVTRPPNTRAGDWQEVAVWAKRHTDRVYIEEKVAVAVETALALARPSDLVLVTGSFYMVGEARAYLLEQED